MKILQENIEFCPIAVVLETKRELEVFWDIMIRVKKCTDKNDEYEMAVKISDWLTTEAHL